MRTKKEKEEITSFHILQLPEHLAGAMGAKQGTVVLPLTVPVSFHDVIIMRLLSLSLSLCAWVCLYRII